MKNSDMPAMPLVNEHGHPFHASKVAFDNTPLTMGLTKLEHATIEAMKGLLSNPNMVTDMHSADPEDIGQYALNMAIGTLSMLDDSKGVNDSE